MQYIDRIKCRREACVLSEDRITWKHLRRSEQRKPLTKECTLCHPIYRICIIYVKYIKYVYENKQKLTYSIEVKLMVVNGGSWLMNNWHVLFFILVLILLICPVSDI